MTTVVYRDGIMASDSQVSSSGRIETVKEKKLFRTGDYVAGLAGDDAGGCRLLGLLKECVKQKKFTLPSITIKKVDCIFAGKSSWWYYEQGWWFPMDRYEYYAIGTGSDYALGALDVGASAVEAVKVAIGRDIYSGGRIQKLEV